MTKQEENFQKEKTDLVLKFSYWKEFWYKRKVNGVISYEPSSRKFWATISWILFILWMPILFGVVLYSVMKWDFSVVNWTAIGSITGVLMGNAQMAIGWYTLDVNNERKNSKTEIYPESQPVGNQEEVEVKEI